MNVAISDSELKVTYIHVHFVRCRCHRSLHGRSCCSLVGHVLLHLVVEAVLVLCGQVFILLLFLGSQIAPALPHDGAHLDKLDSWELSKDLGANVKGEKDKRSSRPLGCRRIPDFFDFPIDSEVFDKVALGIVSWRRDILGHLNIKTGLVLMGPRIPSGLLLRRQTLVHGTGVLGELAKGHARILPPELVAHRVLIEQIRRHGPFRGLGVAFHLAAAASAPVIVQDGVALGIVTWRRYIVRKLNNQLTGVRNEAFDMSLCSCFECLSTCLDKVARLVSFGTSRPSLLFFRR